MGKLDNASPKAYEEFVSNFGRDNIHALERKFSAQGESDYFPDRARTMVQVNTRTAVTVTRENREACADSIVRL